VLFANTNEFAADGASDRASIQRITVIARVLAQRALALWFPISWFRGRASFAFVCWVIVCDWVDNAIDLAPADALSLLIAPHIFTALCAWRFGAPAGFVRRRACLARVVGVVSAVFEVDGVDGAATGTLVGVIADIHAFSGSTHFVSGTFRSTTAAVSGVCLEVSAGVAAFVHACATAGAEGADGIGFAFGTAAAAVVDAGV